MHYGDNTGDMRSTGRMLIRMDPLGELSIPDLQIMAQVRGPES
jgi:hypothetical protein